DNRNLWFRFADFFRVITVADRQFAPGIDDGRWISGWSALVCIDQSGSTEIIAIFAARRASSALAFCTDWIAATSWSDRSADSGALSGVDGFAVVDRHSW